MSACNLVRGAMGLLGIVAVAGAVGWLGTNGSATPAPVALPDTIKCLGNSCGGSGPRNYTYEVTSAATTVYTGLHNASTTLANVLAPSGWTATVFNNPATDDPNFVAHGGSASGTGMCARFIEWTGPSQAAPFLLGFDTLNDPEIHETEWLIPATSSVAQWGRPVGNGLGPIHTPDS